MEEQYLYGSKRLGVWRPGLEMARAAHNPSGYEVPVEPTPPAERFGNACLCTEPIPGDEEPYYPGVAFTARFYTHTLGIKEYEITNHASAPLSASLGNVLATVLDRKTGVKASPTATTYAWFKADVSTAQDYYPFGMMMPGRHYTAGTALDYRYGFNGKEADNEVYGTGNSYDFGARIYDPRVGRWLSVDPLAAKYPFASPFNFVLNRPIDAIDPDGKVVVFANKISERQFNRLYKAANSETKARLDVLKSSEVIYNVNTQASLSGRQGKSEYNFKTEQFDVLVDKKSSNQIGTLGDELTHAYQFETGNLGYIQRNNGQVGTLGYDMEDEVASKRGEISATQAVNAAEGINLPLDYTTQAFQKADTDPISDGMTRNQMIENYFNTDPSAQQYLQNLDPRGKKMGVNIPGSGGYTEGQLKGAVQSGQFKDFIYREKQSDGSMKKIQGNGN